MQIIGAGRKGCMKACGKEIWLWSLPREFRGSMLNGFSYRLTGRHQWQVHSETRLSPAISQLKLPREKQMRLVNVYKSALKHHLARGKKSIYKMQLSTETAKTVRTAKVSK